MNKWIGLLLLSIGVGLTAGFGSVLSPGFRQVTIKQAEAQFADAQVLATQAEYCDRRTKFKLPAADGCSGAEPLAGAGDFSSTAALREAQLQALKANSDVLVVAVSQARIQYQLAIRKSLKRWTELEQLGTESPSARLNGWFDSGGLGFTIGLILVIVGAWISRKAQAGSSDSDSDSNDEGTMDFGELLDRVSRVVDGLHTEMTSTAQPRVSNIENLKSRLEEIQKDELARLCASGPRAQNRYGIEGMAALFSPLSAAERKLNRAWAALVDRHWVEALASIAAAGADLRTTRDALIALQEQ